ncbi:MAG: uridine diphosphate-N-acetylglucosamine-binding protein YvcK [Nitriliruptoraceae bacterium]
MSAARVRVHRAVALGGGHGLARTLAALRRLADEVVAIVSVADDGGSSGRLRRDLDIVPPGDLRMALTALGHRERLAEVLGYRFPRGELAGHALGNLVLVALQDLHEGDLVAALDELAYHLGVAGRVLPCTTDPVTLHARSLAGPVSGQAAIAATSRLERVWLQPEAPAATPAALEALTGADLVVLGPGSLYTSLLPNLLVPELAAAVIAAPGPRVLVANLREQLGETEGMSLADHLEALASHVPALTVDAVLLHDGRTPPGPGRPLDPGPLPPTAPVGRVVRADLLGDRDGHDPDALARALARLV